MRTFVVDGDGKGMTIFFAAKFFRDCVIRGSIGHRNPRLLLRGHQRRGAEKGRWFASTASCYPRCPLKGGGLKKDVGSTFGRIELRIEGSSRIEASTSKFGPPGGSFFYAFGSTSGGGAYP
jgi:hypothetical protein